MFKNYFNHLKMPPLTSSLSQRALPNVCLTPKCVNLAESILSSVNLNVDPCSDFFQYTCKYIIYFFIQDIFLKIY